MTDKALPDALWSGNFSLACAANLSMFMGFHMLTATFAFYVIALGGDEALAGFAAGLFSISAVLMRPLVGWVLDHQGRRAILLLGMAGMVVIPLLYTAFAPLALIIALRTLHGLAWSCSSTAINTAACDIVPRRRFAEGMGYFGLTSALSTAVAPALGLALMGGQGFPQLFRLAAGIEALALLLAFRIKVPALPVDKPRRTLAQSLKTLLDRDALPASLTMLLFLLPYGGITTFVAMYAVSAGLGSGGVYFTCLAVTTALMRALTGRAADRYGEGPMVYAGAACQLVSLILLFAVPRLPGFLLSALLFGMAFGMHSPALQAMAMRIAAPERRGSASSTFLCGYDIGIGLGGIVGGLFVKFFGYSPMYGLMMVFTLLSLALYWFWGRKSPSSFGKL